MHDIQAFADRVAEEFRPRRIILFGSYAYGMPTEDSDVDLMVVFAGQASAADRSLEIMQAVPHPGFPLDLLARSEGEIRHRYRIPRRGSALVSEHASHKWAPIEDQPSDHGSLTLPQLITAEMARVAVRENVTPESSRDGLARPIQGERQ